MKVSVIGVGNMGFPMLKGAVQQFGAENVSFSCKGDAERERAQETGAAYCDSNSSLVAESDLVLLVIKPNVYELVLNEIRDHLKKDAMVLFIGAGITIDFVKKALNGKGRLIRVMPNTPALVGEGMSAVTYDTDSMFSEAEKAELAALFQSVGSFVLLPESLQDAAIPASGSSSAFVYVFIEAMADAAVACGIPRATAYQMTAQTVLGAAKMVLVTGEHPGKLKDDVCTPGGTTIAGIKALEENGFRNAVMQACIASFDKVKSMKK